MAMACVATRTGLLLVSHPAYSNALIPFWNALVRATMYCLVAGLASEVFERKRVEKRLRQTNEDLQKLGRQIAEASDREQRRLGEDLHDGLCQHLVSTAFAARGLAAKLTERALPEAEDAAEIAELLGASISQARDVARGLCLVPLEAGGLASALEELATHVRSRHRIACQFVDKASVPALEEGVGTNLFRIAQEAVNNAIKHAQASHITVTLSAHPEQIALEIEDDGKGVQPGAEPARGMGLHIMNYRARMVGAALTVGHRPGGGTKVSCQVRLQESKAVNHDQRH
jgi:signal transduction histidine kinase